MIKEANCRPLPATLHLTYLSNPSTPRYFSATREANSLVQKVKHIDYTTDCPGILEDDAGPTPSLEHRPHAPCPLARPLDGVHGLVGTTDQFLAVASVIRELGDTD